MKYLVNAIEFDFSDSQGELDEWEQEQICLLYTSDAADE